MIRASKNWFVISNKLKGYLGEILVIFWYMLKFYIPINHRYKSKLGEIDLILRRKDTIVFVEVKMRTGHYDTANLLSKSQKQRLINSANNYLSKNNNYKFVRFDLAIVESLFSIKTYKNWHL
jgi:putative endonuclease